MGSKFPQQPPPGMYRKPPPPGRCTTSFTTREVIEGRLLESLSDDQNVACIFRCEDLTALIDALLLVERPTLTQRTLRHDLIQLRKAAFGV